ncbi:MAG: PHP domain-containing protein [Clostridia bacterium]|nr:PHP domain-containing protein [Clostridia bacterium]
MTLEYLLKRIGDTEISAEERLESLCEIRRLADLGKIKRPEKTVFVNNHIHTCYSFSPYTPSSAVYCAWKAGLQTAGIMDHDSVAGFKEFIIAGRIMDMPVTCGFECRVNVRGTSLMGKKINNPDQESCAYVAMHGVPHQNVDKIEAVLKNLRYLRNVRNRKMVDNINGLVAEYGIKVDFERDVYPLSMARLGGSITERHVCMALTKKITGRYPERKDALDFIDLLCGSKMTDKTREKLMTAPDDFYEYDILGVLKGHLVSRFYVDATDECMNIVEFTNLCKEVGAISAYAYLGDVGESPTGDKKAQKFEDDYIDELFGVLKECGFSAVTYMPSRNTREQLARIIRMCGENGLFQISGEDINSPRQSFICQALADPAYAHLRNSTYALIGHELAATVNIEDAMFSPKICAQYPDLEERTKVFAEIGGINA